ncbi:MAG: KpsF/GutQ family sugar-phosphate isomerase [Bacteroidetes bacterium]|nr:KpsF/GutQ family sugar-phosphate isomerase [Bacteroidota bacterium]MCK5765430.1 KpsF/GutQ family sugar-phosphate isomerase [Bacteroidales bacterium]
MKSSEEIQSIAISTIDNELSAVSGLKTSINIDFVHCVERIIQSDGRVILTGIGKSANIARKIVSTLNSTGTPAIFMHAADAVHGDLGIIREDDIIVCMSKSGETPEIKVLVPLLKSRKNFLIAMVGNSSSYLAKHADLILDTTVEKEACPNNLVPTASTTAQLVMGDALAMALLSCRGFTPEDFARFHPGGSLGKRMYLKVSDLYKNNEKPMVGPAADVKDVIMEISSKRLGAAAVVEGNKLLGIITDGDLRRMLEQKVDIGKLTALDIMTANPSTIEEDELVVNALEMMRENKITQLPVLKNGDYVGVVHMHDIVKEGII